MLLWKELFPFYPTLNSSLLCGRGLILDPWIVFVFFRIASYSSSNQMTASNLGIVFGPTLLRPLWVAYSLFGSVKYQHCVISFKDITMVVTFLFKIIVILSSFREGTGSLASLVDTPHQTRTVELLIINVKVGLSFLCIFAAIVLCIFINYLYLFC